MAFPEGAQENLKSVVHHSRRGPTSPTCLINSTGISVLTAMPPTMGTVQNVGMGAGAESQAQAVILLPSGCHAAERRYDKQATVAVFGTIRNELAIRRPVRLPVMTWSFGDLHRIAATNLLHPNVELAPTVGTVGDEASVW